MQYLIKTLSLCLILFSCSSKSENKEELYNSKLTLDNIAKTPIDQLLKLDSLAQGTNKIFAGTRQEIVRGYGLVRVSTASAKNPESNRHDIPRKWKTSQGIYVGIPIDSLEAINGTPFYVQLKNDTLSIANWEGGKLAKTGVHVSFVMEGGSRPEPFMSSKDIIAKGWTARCVVLTYYGDPFNIYSTGWGEPGQPCQGYPGDFPFLSFKALTETDLEEFPAHNLRLMRNEVFARYGYIFKSEDLKEHFSIKPWYTPKLANIDALLTDIEKANISLLREEEIRYRNRPLAKLIRTLPFLELPSEIHVVGSPHYLDSVMMADLGVTEDLTEVAVFCLLPDTSSVYAFMWTGVSRYQGGGYTGGSESFQNFTYVTTFDKNGNQIQSALVRISAPSNLPSGSETCPLQVTETSMMKRDWSYESGYTIDWRCKVDDGGQVLLPSDDPISGKIEKDGTIH